MTTEPATKKQREGFRQGIKGCRNKQLILRLSEEECNKFYRYADVKGVSKNRLMWEAVDEYINNHPLTEEEVEFFNSL